MARNPLGISTAQSLVVAFGHRPFSRAQALAHGVKPERLRAALEQGHVVRLRRGAYWVPATSSHDDAESLGGSSPTSPVTRASLDRSTALRRAIAESLMHPDSAVSHSAAAIAHGLPLPLRVSPEGAITGPRLRAGVRAGVRYVRGDVAEAPHHPALGVPVTSVERTAVDVARSYGLPDALATVDAALRHLIAVESTGLMDLRDAVRNPELRDFVRRRMAAAVTKCGGGRGARRVRDCVDLADPAAESALESHSRGVLVAAGVPRPACGVPVQGADGRQYWADMLWRDTSTIGECDGATKYTDPSVLYREKLRQESLEEAGWRVVRWGYAEMLNDPDRIVARLRRVMAASRHSG